MRSVPGRVQHANDRDFHRSLTWKFPKEPRKFFFYVYAVAHAWLAKTRSLCSALEAQWRVGVARN